LRPARRCARVRRGLPHSPAATLETAITNSAAAGRCARAERSLSLKLVSSEFQFDRTAESLNADIVGADRAAFERLGARYLRFR
jgi:hypothetical protein